MPLLLNLPNVLREKADQPGGLRPEEAIERARVALVDFRDTYEEWVAEDVKRLKAESVQILAAPGQSQPHVEQLYHIAHEMRGQAATFGLPLLTEIGNYLCRFVEKMGAPRDRDLEILDLHVEAMRLVIAEGGAPDGPATSDMMEGLRAIAEGEGRTAGAS